MASESGSGRMEEAEHRALEVETYRWKARWKRNDVAIIAALVPVLVSIGWYGKNKHLSLSFSLLCMDIGEA